MEFRLLGPLDVVEQDRPLALGGRKQRALLAVLLLNANDVVSTERLIDELWGESPPATVAKSIQVYVSNLRKELGDGRLITRTPGYVLRIEPGELDLARFERMTAEAKGADPATAAQTLRGALSLWRGPPLADLAYEPFAQAPSVRLEELRIAAIEQRIEADLATGRHADLVGELEALGTQHPMRERLRGQLMLCLYRCGRQAEALDAYQSTRRALVEGLGIEPSRELRDLHQAILEQNPQLDPAVAPATVTAAPARTFIGRTAELGELVAALDDVFAGHGRLFLIEGEPGIGKSRLAEELIAHARARGARVLVGRCWEAGGAPAYWPWVQSLRTYLRDADSATVREQLGDGAADIAQIVPDVQRRFPGLPQPPSLESQAARFRLFDATAEFLRRASAGVPIVLVLDDLHAADEPSLLLLRFLARELHSTHVMILGAYRDIDPIPTRFLSDTLADIAREPVSRRLSLTGLSEHEVAEFVELSGSEISSPGFAATLCDETEGNPLFVGEIVRLRSVEGDLAIPQTVRDVIARRLTHLSDECHGMLVLASVLGREFALDALARLSDAGEDKLLRLLDEAMAAQVVSDVPGNTDRLRFAHVLIRDTLYEGLTTVRRVRLHRRVVEVLEALYGDEPGPHLAELAHHSVAAKQFGKGLLYARIAGDRALALLAYEEAARLYESALEALDATRPGDSAARGELLLAAGDALVKAGSTDRAKATFLVAADLARTAGLPEHLGRAALGYGGRFIWQRAWDDRRLVPLLEEALTALGDDSFLRAKLLARLAGARRDERSLEPRSSLSREAVAIARRLGDKETLAYALVGQFMATWGPDVDELVEIADEVSRLAEEIAVPERELEAVTLLSIARWTIAESEVEALNDQYEALADRLKQPAQRWLADMVITAWALFQGRLAEAEKLAEDTLRSGDAQSADAHCSYCLAMFVLRRDQGRLQEIEDLVRTAVDRYPGYSTFRCYAALLDCELGRDDAARHAFEALAAGDFAGLPRDDEWLACMSLLAEVTAHLDDRERAAVLYGLLAPYARLNALVSGEVSLGCVARYVGILAATTSRWTEAEEHFEHAIAVNARMGARSWLARSQHDYARMLFAADRPGDRERARAALEAARALYEELGMKSYAASAQPIPAS